MSQGITIKGKTAAGENVEVQVDALGRLITTPDATYQPGFSPTATITTEINGDVITQTDGDRVYTVTIAGDTITEVWS